MADSAPLPGLLSASLSESRPARHPLVVRLAHWLVTFAFCALLLTGIEILISHPRFYWGETGNVMMQPLFSFPIPASRASVPTGYGYVLPDQNGWSRNLHFESAWLLVLSGIVYVAYGLLAGYFSRHLWLRPRDLTGREFSAELRRHLRLRTAHIDRYNTLQRLAYLVVIFFLFPMVIWTGLAMSPGIVAALPWLVSTLGGQQSARTLHLFVSIALSVFLILHVLMICINGFAQRMRSITIGSPASDQENA